jgi:hypothetical protein
MVRNISEKFATSIFRVEVKMEVAETLATTYVTTGCHTQAKVYFVQMILLE